MDKTLPEYCLGLRAGDERVHFHRNRNDVHDIMCFAIDFER